MTGFIRGSGGCDVTFVKKCVMLCDFDNDAFSKGIIRYSCLRNFTVFTKKPWFREPCLFYRFYKGSGGGDVAFAKKSVSSFAFFETMLFQQVL